MRIKDENEDDENKVQNKVQKGDVNCTLSRIEQEVIDFIAANPQATQKQIADSTGKSVRTIKTIMQELQEKRLIKRIGSKKTGQWVIN
jgi:ATP-dependent DNA helicase RecG